VVLIHLHAYDLIIWYVCIVLMKVPLMKKVLYEIKHENLVHLYIFHYNLTELTTADQIGLFLLGTSTWCGRVAPRIHLAKWKEASLDTNHFIFLFVYIGLWFPPYKASLLARDAGSHHACTRARVIKKMNK
jgi:hypothetical protein